jgi:hypothetical protein
MNTIKIGDHVSPLEDHDYLNLTTEDTGIITAVFERGSNQEVEVRITHDLRPLVFAGSELKLTYDAAYFYNKLSEIPEEEWTTEAWNLCNGSKCVLGHLGEAFPDKKDTTLSKAFKKLLQSQLGDYFGWEVNDGRALFKELGDTPKERVLNALVLIDSGIYAESEAG